MAALRVRGGTRESSRLGDAIALYDRILAGELGSTNEAQRGEVERARAHADGQRAVLSVQAEGAETLDVREEVCWGDVPAREILKAADREEADLVVMGTHGHGAVRRALLGSVATAVARDATCPVLLVPPALWKE